MQFVNLSVGRHDGLTVVGAVDPVLRRLSALLETDPLALLLLLLLRLGRRLQNNKERNWIKICPYVNFRGFTKETQRPRIKMRNL